MLKRAFSKLILLLNNSYIASAFQVSVSTSRACHQRLLFIGQIKAYCLAVFLTPCLTHFD